MSGRYATPQATATRPTSAAGPTFEGDEAFLGMNLATDPGQLAPGYFVRAENTRLVEGKPRKRAGSVMPGWCNAVDYSAILGEGVYSNPNGEALLLIATPTDVWKMPDGGLPHSVGLPAGVTLSGAVEFSQQFEKVLLHQASGPTLGWTGDATEGFKVRTKSDPLDTETELVPDTPWSMNFADREIFPVPGTQDSFGASLVGDYTSWIPGLSGTKFRANSGTADVLTGAFPFLQGNLIIGKKNSIDRFANFGGNLANVSSTELSRKIGIWSRRSYQLYGSDAVFLSGGGVYRLMQVDESRLEASPVPVAVYREGARVVDPLQPFWARVNWSAAVRAVAGQDGPYYVLALPIDGSTVNNCLVIFNLLTNTVESIDTWLPAAQMQIDNLLPFNYQGEPRLYAVNHRTKSVHLLHQGKFDVTTTGRHEIRSVFETRGYAELGWNGTTSKNFKVVQIPLATWRPSIVIELMTERASDVRLLTTEPITKRNWRYRKFGQADYDRSNVNDDAEAPGREDYSVELVEGQALNFGSGIDLEKKQEHVERRSLRARGRYGRFRITSTRGDCDILGVYLESAGGQRERRKAA